MSALNGSGRVSLITGGTGGIGLSIAVGIAKLGGTTVIVGRDRERGEAALTEIKDRARSNSVELMLADLSSQQDIRRLASDFVSRYGRLDVLVNNVGGLYGKRWETVDGIEGTLAINHLCPFLLTHLLLPVLQSSRPARIVNINSEGHRAAKTVDFDSFQAARWKRGFLMYSQSKLANLLFTYELAARLNREQVTVNAVDPGIVDTQLFRRFVAEKASVLGVLSGAAAFVIRNVAYCRMKFDTIETAAECPVYLASSDEVGNVSGKYFKSNKNIVASSPKSYDTALSAHVWQVSAELCGLASQAASASVCGGSIPQNGVSDA